MRKINQVLASRGLSEYDDFHETVFPRDAQNDARTDPVDYWPRHDLLGSAASMTTLAERARDLPAAQRRGAHDKFLGYARQDLTAWRALGGFLP